MPTNGTAISTTNNDPRLDDREIFLIGLVASIALLAFVETRNRVALREWQEAQEQHEHERDGRADEETLSICADNPKRHGGMVSAHTYAGSELARRYNWWTYAVSFMDAGIALGDFSQRGMMAALAPAMTQPAWNVTVAFLRDLGILDARPGRGTHLREGIDWQAWRASPVWRRKAGVTYPVGDAPEPITPENSETMKQVNNEAVSENSKTVPEPPEVDAESARVEVRAPIRLLTAREVDRVTQATRFMRQYQRRAD